MPIVLFEIHLDILVLGNFLRFIVLLREEHLLHALDHPVTTPQVYENSPHQHTDRQVIIRLRIPALLKRLPIPNGHKHHNYISNGHHDWKQPHDLLQSGSQVEIELMRDDISSEYKILILPIENSQCKQAKNKSRRIDETYTCTK